MDAGAFGARLDPKRRLPSSPAARRWSSATAGSGAPGPTARLPGGRGPLGQHGVVPRSLRRRSPPALADPTGPGVVRQGSGRKGNGGRDGGHRLLLPRRVPRGHDVLAGRQALQGGLGEDDRGRGEVQRPRPLHRLHRLRVDLAGAARTEPAPGRHLPRRRDKASQTVPCHHLSAQGSTDPEYLWKLLQAYEDKTGGDVLAIAHNGNLSNGMMFPLVNPVGNKPLTPEYARDGAPAGSRSTRRPRSRATARRTRSCRPTTSSPTSAPGTRATST